MGLSNLPPGVSDNDIPGNRPEDIAWETFHENVDEDCNIFSYTPEDARIIWDIGSEMYKLIHALHNKLRLEIKNGK